MAVPPIEECYGWMFRCGGEESKLDVLHDLRMGIKDLPETAGSFALSDATEYHHTNFEDEMFWMLGTWRLPDRATPARNERWVNPNYVHKRIFADVVVECECGAVMGRERDRGSWDGEHNHTDSCRSAWRESARERLQEEREEWIRKAARLYLSYEEAAPRMGIHYRNVGQLCDKYGIEWQERRMEGRQRAVNTWRRLHDEHQNTWHTIATAFGESSATVRSYARGHGGDFDE